MFWISAACRTVYRGGKHPHEMLDHRSGRAAELARARCRRSEAGMARRSYGCGLHHREAEGIQLRLRCRMLWNVAVVLTIIIAFGGAVFALATDLPRRPSDRAAAGAMSFPDRDRASPCD